MTKTIKAALVTMGLAMPGAAFAGYTNSYNCPGDAGDAYMDLFDSAGNTIELCQSQWLTPQSYGLKAIKFITGYSGGSPIYEEAFGHVSTFSLYASATGGEGYGYAIAAHTSPTSNCSWSVEAGTYSATAPAMCFGSKETPFLTIDVTPVIP